MDPSPSLLLAEDGFELFASPGTRQLTGANVGTEIALFSSWNCSIELAMARMPDTPKRRPALSTSTCYIDGINNRSRSHFPKPFAPANRYSKSAAKNSGGWNSP